MNVIQNICMWSNVTLKDHQNPSFESRYLKQAKISRALKRRENSIKFGKGLPPAWNSPVFTITNGNENFEEKKSSQGFIDAFCHDGFELVNILIKNLKIYCSKKIHLFF